MKKTVKHAKDFTPKQVHEMLEMSRGYSAPAVASYFGTTAAVVLRLIRKAGGPRLPLGDDPYPMPDAASHHPKVTPFTPGVMPCEVFIMGVDDSPEAEETLNEIFSTTPAKPECKLTSDDIDAIAHEAETAFWDVIAKRLPATRNGDMDPVDATQFANYCKSVVRTWVNTNFEGYVSFDEFPGIEFPKFLRDLGCQDRSWHNDLCARAFLPLQGYTEEAGYPALSIWCEHAAVEDREIDNHPRFIVEAHLNYVPEEFVCNFAQSPNHAILYEGEDPVACEAAIQKVLGTIFTQTEHELRSK